MALTPQQELDVIAMLAERAAAATDAADRALDRRALRNGESTLTAQERTRLTAARTRWAGTVLLDQPARATRLVSAPVNVYAQVLDDAVIPPPRVLEDALVDLDRRVTTGEVVPDDWMAKLETWRAATTRGRE